LQDALLLQFQALAPLSLIAVQSRNMMVSGFWRGPSSSVGILVVAGNLGIGSSDHPRMALQGRRHALALSDRCLGGFYATSGGKIMLAHMPDALRQKYLAKVEFEAETKNTISSIKSCDIGSVRQGKQGSPTPKEFTTGIVGLAKASLSEGGEPLGSINVALPAVRFDTKVEKLVTESLTEAKLELERRIRF